MSLSRTRGGPKGQVLSAREPQHVQRSFSSLEMGVSIEMGVSKGETERPKIRPQHTDYNPHERDCKNGFVIFGIPQ